jgi:phage gpG-like protein
VEFKIVSYGVPVVLRKIEMAQAAATNLKPALDKIMEYVFEVETELFDAEGERGGPRWHPLSYRWLQTKRRKNLDLRILRATGDLYDSLTKWRHPLQILRIEGKTGKIVFGSKRPYARVHWDGLEFQYFVPGQDEPEVGSIPKRRFIRFTSQDRDDMADFLRTHITAAYRR